MQQAVRRRSQQFLKILITSVNKFIAGCQKVILSFDWDSAFHQVKREKSTDATERVPPEETTHFHMFA